MTKREAMEPHEAGRDDGYVVRTADPSAGRWQISSEGGEQPRWARDGKAIFFRNGNSVLKAAVTAGVAFQSEKPIVLFEGRYRQVGGVGGYDVAADGRLLMVKNESDVERAINVVINWTAEIRRAILNQEARQ